MPIYEFKCEKCSAHREALLTYQELVATREITLTCPACGDATGAYKETIPSRAPMGRIGGEGSERDIAAMQKEFRERFYKSGEADQVRHKHGTALDDSIRGAAAQRIQDALASK